jgi:hypothetical protein
MACAASFFQEMMRSRDEVRAQLKALDLDFIKCRATADERLRQVNSLTAQLDGEREKVGAQLEVHSVRPCRGDCLHVFAASVIMMHRHMIPKLKSSHDN